MRHSPRCIAHTHTVQPTVAAGTRLAIGGIQASGLEGVDPQQYTLSGTGHHHVPGVAACTLVGGLRKEEEGRAWLGWRGGVGKGGGLPWCGGRDTS